MGSRIVFNKTGEELEVEAEMELDELEQEEQESIYKKAIVKDPRDRIFNG